MRLAKLKLALTWRRFAANALRLSFREGPARRWGGICLKTTEKADDDFPTDAHNEVVGILGPRQGVSEIAAGWNAVAIRFKSAANADERYTVSIRSEEAFNSPDERVVQQEALFAFFMNGYAALESFAYAAFAMGSMLRPADFPMGTPNDLRAINLKTASSRFTTSFSGTEMAAALSALIDDPECDRWGDIPTPGSYCNCCFRWLKSAGFRVKFVASATIVHQFELVPPLKGTIACLVQCL